MPKVNVPLPVEGFELCHPENPEDFALLNAMINGTPRAGSWESPPMELIRVENGRERAESDSPWLGAHALIFRRPAIRTLEDFFLSYGELLPLSCARADLVIFNPTRIIDALDEGASEIVRFSSGRIMRVARYEFRSAEVLGVDIFKIPNLRSSPTFVSERFVELVKAAGLRGLNFTTVWST